MLVKLCMLCMPFILWSGANSIDGHCPRSRCYPQGQHSGEVHRLLCMPSLQYPLAGGRFYRQGRCGEPFLSAGAASWGGPQNGLGAGGLGGWGGWGWAYREPTWVVAEPSVPFGRGPAGCGAAANYTSNQCHAPLHRTSLSIL